MKNSTLILPGFFLCLLTYLFVSAPPELPEVSAGSQDARPIDVSNMFNAMNAINDTARRIYTSRIVGGGKKAGLAFGEDWADPGVEKGPLPALFLRLVAGRMEAKPPQLGLYLGSDQPINKSNLFSGAQSKAFEKVKQERARVFLESDTAGYLAMYPDIASAGPCVTCHNDHKDSPKTDWKMNEVMGATTWTYPHQTLGSAEYLDITEAFYTSVREAYETYLAKAQTFASPIPVGQAWPDSGTLILPDADTFMAEVRAQSAMLVLDDLVLSATEKFESLDLGSVQ